MNSVEKPTCDASSSHGIKLGCKNDVVVYCTCSKCSNEPDQRFYSCQEHITNVESKHLRIYSRPPIWSVIEFSGKEKTPEKTPMKDDWGGAKQW